MSDSQEKSSWLKDTLTIMAVLLVGYLYVRGLVRKTGDAAGGRKFWLYPWLALQWLIVGPVLIFLVLLLAMICGYAMDVPILLGIDYALTGRTGGAVTGFIVGPVVILAATGYLYEVFRQALPTASRRTVLAVTIATSLLLTVLGILPYLACALEHVPVWP